MAISETNLTTKMSIRTRSMAMRPNRILFLIIDAPKARYASLFSGVILCCCGRKVLAGASHLTVSAVMQRRDEYRLSCTSDNDPADQSHVTGARCHGNAGGRSSSRTVFTRAQLDAMEDRFIRQSFLTREERIEFAEEIHLTERQVLVWFQNRR